MIGTYFQYKCPYQGHKISSSGLALGNIAFREFVYVEIEKNA